MEPLYLFLKVMIYWKWFIDGIQWMPTFPIITIKQIDSYVRVATSQLRIMIIYKIRIWIAEKQLYNIAKNSEGFEDFKVSA